MTADTMCPLTV